MNQREFLQAVIEANVAPELVEYAKNAIAKMGATNAKRKEKANEKNEEKKAMIQRIVDKYLNAEPQTATQIKDALVGDGFEREDDKDVNTQFVSATMRKAVELGLAKSTDLKVKGGRVAKGYFVE